MSVIDSRLFRAHFFPAIAFSYSELDARSRKSSLVGDSLSMVLTFAAAIAALTVLVGHPIFASLIITEVNLDHGERNGSTARTVATGLAAAFLAGHPSEQRGGTALPFSA